jgi:hypothetical protein
VVHQASPTSVKHSSGRFFPISGKFEPNSKAGLKLLHWIAEIRRLGSSDWRNP